MCAGFGGGLDRRDRPKKTTGDNVKSFYQDFVKHKPGLNANNAPNLFEYLSPAADGALPA